MIEHAVLIGAPALITLAIVRIMLLAQSANGPRLKTGMPSGRLAPPRQVHAALTGQRRRRT